MIPAVSGKTEVGEEEEGLKKGMQNLWRWRTRWLWYLLFFKVSVNR